MKITKICFFNINRLDFEGGAEKYIRNMSLLFLKIYNYETYYFGGFKLILYLYVMIEHLIIRLDFKELFSELRKINISLKKVNKSEYFTGVEYISISNIFNLKRNYDIWVVKNEIIDLFVHQIFFDHKKINICVIFTTIKYNFNSGIRAKFHNYLYNSKFYFNLLSKYDYIIVSNNFDYMFIKLRPESDFEKKLKIIVYPIDKKTTRIYNRNNFLYFNSNNNLKIKVGFIGRLEHQKGIFDFIELAERLGKNNFIFYIIGTGSLKNQVQKRISNLHNIFLIGFVPSNELSEYYYNLDIVVIPSKWETFCFVALEAQSLGIPVLSYDIPGPNEIIINNVTGKLVNSLNDMETELINFKDAEWKIFDNSYFLNKYSESSFINKYLSFLK